MDKDEQTLGSFTDEQLRAELQHRADAREKIRLEGLNEAYRQIDELIKTALDALRKAEELADQHKISFQFKPAYGMGGVYYGDDDGWVSSSQNC